jgi:hypothetical protein
MYYDYVYCYSQIKSTRRKVVRKVVRKENLGKEIYSSFKFIG